MAYDPRLAALADGLYTQRFGKTVLVVADDTARDALDPAVTPVTVTASDDLLNIYDTDASAWMKLGKDDIVTVATVADLDGISNPEDVKLAIVDETSEIYRYDGAAWVLCAGGGSGGSGLEKVSDEDALEAIENPEDGDTVVVLDSKSLKTFDAETGRWQYPIAGEDKRIVAGGNWNYVDGLTLTNATASRDFELEDGRYLIVADVDTSILAANGGFSFGTNVFFQQYLVYGGASSKYTNSVLPLAPYPFSSASGYHVEMNITLDNGYVHGQMQHTRANSTDSAMTIGSTMAFSLDGVDTNVMSLITSVAMTGKISVYRWEDIRATEYHTYELVKELHFDNEIVDFTIPWDGEEDPDLHIVCTSSGPMSMLINDDDGSSSYKRAFHGGGTSHYSQVDISAYISIGPSNCLLSITDAYLKVGSGFRGIDVHAIKAPTTGDRYSYVFAYAWNNVVDPVTSLRFFSNGTVTSGMLKIYKLAKTQLMDTAINKIASETELLNIPAWDGKLALTLDTKQLFVYDAIKKTWLGKSGVKMAAGNFTTNELVGEYTEVELNAGIAVDVNDTSKLYIEGTAISSLTTTHVGITDDANTQYTLGRILAEPDVSGGVSTAAYVPIGWGDTRFMCTLNIDASGMAGFVSASYYTQGYEKLVSFRGNVATKPGTVTIQAVDGSYEAGTLIRVYREKSMAIPDFASAEANLYGWKLKGTTAAGETKVIAVNSDTVRVCAKTVDAGLIYVARVGVNGGGTYLMNHMWATASTSASGRQTTGTIGFSGVPEGYFPTQGAYYEMTLVNDTYGVRMKSELTLYDTGSGNVQPIFGSGYILGTGALNSITVGAADVVCEVYEWGPIEIPYLTTEGGGGLAVMSVTDDATLASGMYVMADTSAGAVTLTMPDDPDVGAELIILDAMRTFGQAGHECTLLSPNTMIEGSTEAVDLNVEGKEYKFRFVGGTMGWRML